MDIFLTILKVAFSNYYFSIFIHILIFTHAVLIVIIVIFDKIFDNKITEDNKGKVNLEKTKDNKEKVGIKKTKEDKLKLFKDSFLGKVN